MKILIVNNLYPPHSRGGAESAVVNEARELVALGHDVTVLTTAPGLRMLTPRETNEDGVRVVRFFPLNIFWYRNDFKHSAPVRALWHFFTLSNWHANSVLKRCIKKYQPDAVHLHNINGMSYEYPRVCEALRVRTVFTLHAVHYAVPSGVIKRGQPSARFFAPFAVLLRKKLHTHAIITAPSKWLFDFYLARGFFRGQQCVIIPNPLSEKRLFDFEEHRAVPPSGGTSVARPDSNIGTTRVPRNEQAFFGHAPRFLYVGQLEPYKGINVLLAALKQLPSELRWQLDIVGEGSMTTELRKQRDQHIRIRGRLEGQELIEAYASAQVLIMPSLCEENAPMVIAEALSQGLPVIASAIGGIPEMIKEGKIGMLFGPGNVEELALHCRRVLEHPELLTPMREAARKIAKRYDPEKIANSYVAVLTA